MPAPSYPRTPLAVLAFASLVSTAALAQTAPRRRAARPLRPPTTR